ncbi:hypothetical protein QAD02_004608 [Eretmocerus hayati]|uniref:Uncharacterized protein n=1 Tax=Eretmocerus hayati TaxID=131215 RepID=A0ACC2NRW4_9HYME|nr:hypothetical protein QAD02_004608 [Eretmocerus hayati]
MAMGSTPATQRTPESEAGSFECFQNYTAPEVFVQGLAGIVDQQDVESMIRAQKQMLQRFEKTNEMLTNCNQLSINRLKSAGSEFKKHTALLVEMKKDLDYIFKKVKILRTKLNQQHPQAYSEAVKETIGEEMLEEDADYTCKEIHDSKQLQKGIPAEKGTDSKEQSKGGQLPKVRKDGIKRADSSSTETENDDNKQDSTSYSSDTS